MPSFSDVLSYPYTRTPHSFEKYIRDIGSEKAIKEIDALREELEELAGMLGYEKLEKDTWVKLKKKVGEKK